MPRLVVIQALVGSLLLLVVGVSGADDKSEPPSSLLGLPLVYSDDFESGSAERWQTTDAEAWQLLKQDGNTVYNQHKKKSDFEPPVRSPYNRSLIKDVTVSDFVLDVRLQSTHPDYGHRDLCLFFGYQDDSHLYYVHFGKEADPNANNIFLVNGALRKNIATKTTEGTNWDDEWHQARVVRNVADGTIAVYFDDMETPVMTAVDKTFTWGRVGVGSFDDTGNFDDVLVYGKQAETP